MKTRILACMALLAATGAAQDAQSRADAMTRNEIMAMTWAEAKATGNRYIMERWRKLDDEELEHKQTVWYRELPAKIERAKKQAEAERAKKQAEAERERARLEAERAALEAQLAETQRLIAEETARLERLAAYCGNGSLYFKRTMFGFGPWAEVDELSGESIPVEEFDVNNAIQNRLLELKAQGWGNVIPARTVACGDGTQSVWEVLR